MFKGKCKSLGIHLYSIHSCSPLSVFFKRIKPILRFAYFSVLFFPSPKVVIIGMVYEFVLKYMTQCKLYLTLEALLPCRYNFDLKFLSLV